MTSTKKDSALVVLQLSGGDDALNTIIPYSDPRYNDNRPVVRIDQGQACPSTTTWASTPTWPP